MLRTILAALAVALSLCSPVFSLDPPSVEISVDNSGPSTRLVLTHSRRVTHAVLFTGGRLEVLYTEPVELRTPAREIDDGILARWDLVDRTRLVLQPGPGYQRYETYELRNPDRLILDLQGDRAAAAADLPPPPPPGPEPEKTVVVIDPGHGGSENGAVGPTGLREKDVALDLARRLKRVLQRDPGVSVVLTRDEDRRLDLDERTAVANHNQADLFISIHLNSSPRSAAYGAETYFLSAEATDDEARTLAALENRAHRVDTHLTDQGELRDLELVLWDLAQNRHLAESAALAESVQTHMNELTGTRDRGVRQAPFRVLMGATMPAILVEVGFISNREEEDRFRGLSYRNRVVEAIANAVDEFRVNLEVLAGPDAATGSGAR